MVLLGVRGGRRYGKSQVVGCLPGVDGWMGLFRVVLQLDVLGEL